MEEEFRAIDDFPNYFIGSNGTVKNSRGHEKAIKSESNGYKHIDLYADGKRSIKRVHRLVAEAFIPNPDNKPDVNHIDGNKLNNSVDNLEWVTKSENMQHAFRTGLNKYHPTSGMRGHKNPNGGAKGRKVRIVETGEVFKNIKTCAEAINGSDRRICDCLNGKICTHMNYHFEEA